MPSLSSYKLLKSDSLGFLCSIWKASQFCLNFSLHEAIDSYPTKNFSHLLVYCEEASQLQALTGNFQLSLCNLNFRRTSPFPSPLFQVISCCSLGGLVRSKAWDTTLNNKARGQDWVLNHSQNLSLLSQPPNRDSASGSGTVRGRIRRGEGGWRKTQYQLLPWAGTRGCLHASIWHLVNEQ